MAWLLPGYTYPGDDLEGFAHYRETVRVVENYAASNRAPVREHTEVIGLAEDAGGRGFVLSLVDGSIHTVWTAVAVRVGGAFGVVQGM